MSGSAPNGGGLPPVREEILGNGLKILLARVPGPGVVSVWCWYRVGSRNERPGITGIAHWVEHMNFKGTEKIPVEEIKKRIERVGGSWNGYTYLDVTTYLETVPGEALEGMIELEAERMARCLYDPKEVDSERTVVISELQGGENDPLEYLDREVTGTALQAHPYRWPTIGYLSDLEAITRADLEAFYRTWYVPNNATLVIVGDFDPGAAVDMARRHFGPIPRGAEPPPVRTREGEQQGERRVTVRRPGTTAYLQAAFPAPAVGDDDFYPLLMADAVLAGGRSLNIWSPLAGGTRRSSRLYRALVDAGVAAEVGTGLLPTVQPFLYTVRATVREGASIGEVEKRIEAELERLAAETVDDGEFERARNQVRARYVFDADSVTDLAHQLGFFETIDSWRTFLSIPDRLDGVTPADVRRVAAATFPEKRRTVGLYLPEGAGASGSASRAGPARVAGARLATGRRPQPAVSSSAPPAGAAIEPARAVLANGVVAIVHSRPSFPSLAVRVIAGAGSMFDPPGRAGLAWLTARMLDRGTGDRSAAALAERVDRLGAVFDREADAHHVSLGATMLPEHLPGMLDHLREIVREPVFPEEELEKARRETLTLLGQEEEDPAAVATRRLHEEIYPDPHPYRRPILGYRGDLTAIDRGDMERFHRRHYRPGATAVVVVVGGRPPEEILAAVEESFGDWRVEGAAPDREIGPAPLPRAAARSVAPMPAKTQTEILLGFPGLPRSHPDFYAALLMSHVLGQFGMGGRIGRRVREAEGLAYYAYCLFQTGLGPAPFVARMGVNPERAERAIALLGEELERMRREGATEEEIDDSRRFLTGSLALRLETSEGIADFLANAELFGLGIDFHRRYPEILAAVTREAVNRAAREHLHPDRAVLVLAGAVPPG